MVYLCIIILGYLLGSFPVAYWVTRLTTGRDLRRIGTGNVGVMATFLHAGPRRGLLVMLLEGAKGFGAVLMAQQLVGDERASALALLAVVIGTNWSFWLGGAGSRGNTAFGGGLLLISWTSLLAILVANLLVRWITGSMFIATRVRILAQPVIIAALTGSLIYGAMALAVSAIFWSKHRPETDDHIQFRKRWHRRLRALLKWVRR